MPTLGPARSKACDERSDAAVCQDGKGGASATKEGDKVSTRSLPLSATLALSEGVDPPKKTAPTLRSPRDEVHKRWGRLWLSGRY